MLLDRRRRTGVLAVMASADPGTDGGRFAPAIPSAGAPGLRGTNGVGIIAGGRAALLDAGGARSDGSVLAGRRIVRSSSSTVRRMAPRMSRACATGSGVRTRPRKVVFGGFGAVLFA
jgi:hypothetical protein